MIEHKLVNCSFERHASSILDIFNEAILNSTALYDYKRACTEFCVNGHLAGNCHLVWRHNELEETRRT